MQLIPELASTLSTIATHLAKQRGQSHSNGRCMYRNGSGRMCAVGCLIPDELYHPNLEGSVGNFGGGEDEHHTKVMAHLRTTIPGLWPDSLLSFLAITQGYHDFIKGEATDTSYLLTLEAAPEGISDEDLKDLIEKDLLAYFVKFPKEEWFVCPT